MQKCGISALLICLYAASASPSMVLQVPMAPKQQRDSSRIDAQVRDVLFAQIHAMRDHANISAPLTPAKGAAGSLAIGAGLLAISAIFYAAVCAFTAQKLTFTDEAKESCITILRASPEVGWFLGCAYLALLVPVKSMMGTHPNFDGKSLLLNLPDEVKQSSDMMLLLQELQKLEPVPPVQGQPRDGEGLAPAIMGTIHFMMQLNRNGSHDALIYDRFAQLCKQYDLEKELASVPSKWEGTGRSFAIGLIAVALGIGVHQLVYG